MIIDNIFVLYIQSMNNSKDTTQGEQSEQKYTYVPRNFIKKGRLAEHFAIKRITRKDYGYKTNQQKVAEFNEIKIDFRDIFE